MKDHARSLVDQQIGRVQRRLLLQVVLRSLFLGWAVALVLIACWFLVRPIAFSGLSDVARWMVPAAILGLGTLASLAAAWLHRPSRILSSLALDDKFELKERVTTLLTLSTEQLQTAVGQALLQDVCAHLSSMQIASKFPVQVCWRESLMPLGAFTLALIAGLLEPVLSDFHFGTRTVADQPRQVADAKELQDQLENLKKMIQQRNQEQLTKSESLKELEKEFEKLINQPLDTKSDEKVRDRVNEFRNLEDKMKERMDGLKEKTEKSDLFKKQLEKLALAKDSLLKEGATKDLEDALSKGQFDKAKEVLERLAKDLKNDKLSKEKQKELADQMKQLQEKLQKLLDNDELMKKLKQDLKDGKISKEELQREMDNFKDLQNLNDILGQVHEDLEKLGGKDAGKKLDELMERFQQMELTEAEMHDLLRDQDELDEAMRLLLAQRGEGEGEGDNLDGGGLPGRRRPIDPKDPKSKIVNQRQKAQSDPKGTQRVTGYARGGNFNKIPSKEIEGAFQQAVQEAPEALDRQRIPADAADIARGYFRKLGNQKE